MMNKVPICFIHSGFNEHLLLAMKQAKHYNPGSEIFLIGDKANKHLDQYCTHILAADSSNSIDAFAKVYQHSSTNSFHFEFICFKRWFLLLEFMQQRKLEWVCTMDSDFMLYCSVDGFFESTVVPSNVEAAYCIPQQAYEDLRWTASGHIAFVSVKFLEAFCAFVIQTYAADFSLFEKKINYHLTQKKAGGICDMTLLYLYYLHHSEKVLNLLVLRNQHVFDHNINTAHNYLPLEFPKRGEYKDVKLHHGKVYAFNAENRKVFFNGLHFQGDAKKEMIHYYYDGIAILRHKVNRFINRVNNKVRRSVG